MQAEEAVNIIYYKFPGSIGLRFAINFCAVIIFYTAYLCKGSSIKDVHKVEEVWWIDEEG